MTLIEKCRDPDVPRIKNMANKIFKDLAIGEWHCLAITHKKKVLLHSRYISKPATNPIRAILACFG